LTILPEPKTGDGLTDVSPTEWDAVEAGAEQVGETLEKTLRLERQDHRRTGQTSGQLDSRQAYRLGMGDTRVFSREAPGDEKEYALVLVLDRSSSMGTGNGQNQRIRAATQATARFALAAEDLNIDVAIIDFYNYEARLVKPFSVPTEEVRGSLLADDTKGGTPLSDALELAANLVEERVDEPLIVTMTDDKPGDIEAVKRVVASTYAPVCSLTIATDKRRGNAPASAKELEAVYERTATVFNASALDQKLDRFASLMAGL
jgi:Mg-chelatase subunit ChlD